MSKQWMQKGLRYSRGCLLASVFGLLAASAYAAPAQTNTSAPAAADDNAPVVVETFAVPNADHLATPTAPLTPSSPGKPATLTPARAADGARPERRIALLLPLRSESLGAVAQVILSGFMAAWENESDGIQVSQIDSGDDATDVLDSYQLALAQHDVLVGPLPRAAVSNLIDSGVIGKPTIALNQPEAALVKHPANLLLMGLSIEDEARQVAQWAASTGTAKSGKMLIVSSNIAWQKRAAKAFALQWQKQGMESFTQEISASSGFLSATGLAQLKNRMATEKPSQVFVALDAEQARQLRHVIGSDIPMFGTSQLNRIALADGEEPEPVLSLDGVRLLELPWQLQRDHPAVMIYPRLIQSGEQKRSADLERFYALGIDAYRVARALALNPGKGLELDGVTGKLAIGVKKGAYTFERTSQAAIYRQGLLQPMSFGPYSQAPLPAASGQ